MGHYHATISPFSGLRSFISSSEPTGGALAPRIGAQRRGGGAVEGGWRHFSAAEKRALSKVIMNFRFGLVRQMIPILYQDRHYSVYSY